MPTFDLNVFTALVLCRTVTVVLASSATSSNLDPAFGIGNGLRRPRDPLEPFLFVLAMQSSRCKKCDQPSVEIDHWGERLTGCYNCNRWQASNGEWCRLAPDDIVALRALKSTKTETPGHSETGATE
jgi:hypothetical protein